MSNTHKTTDKWTENKDQLFEVGGIVYRCNLRTLNMLRSLRDDSFSFSVALKLGIEQGAIVQEVTK